MSNSQELKQSLADVVISVVLGAFCTIVFLILLFWVKLPFVLTLPVAIVIFVVLIIATSKKRRDTVIKIVNTTPEVKQLLQTVSSKMKQIYEFDEKITDVLIKNRLAEVNDITNKIFNILQQDPRKVKSARQFTSYYLDSTLKVLKLYVDLNSHGSTSSELQATTKKVEGLLINLKDAYQSQLDKLLKNDLLDLNTEIKVLESLLKSDN